jgi:hypothetical protein
MKLTETLIQALVTQEERAIFKTTYDKEPCEVHIGDRYLVLKFKDGVILQQNEEDIIEGKCFDIGEIEMYTSITDAHIIVTAKVWLERFGNLELK